jgi:uncharacterized membrane protein
MVMTIIEILHIIISMYPYLLIHSYQLLCIHIGEMSNKYNFFLTLTVIGISIMTMIIMEIHSIYNYVSISIYVNSFISIIMCICR